MNTECAREAQTTPRTGHSTGFRRLTPSLLRADTAADSFHGLPAGVEHHGALLAAFKTAAPRLGISIRLVHAVDWLFRYTRPQDWESGQRPIVWPSTSTQRDAFGLSESGVRNLNRGLIDAGLLTMRDSPNGKRYGARDRSGRITEAYGFDLSPIATRHGEFVRVAAEAKIERDAIAHLRRRGTIARKAIAQILETAVQYGFYDEQWHDLRLQSQTITTALRAAERLEEIAIGVGSLERRHTEARDRLQRLLDLTISTAMPAENSTHIVPTHPSLDPSQDTVLAHKGCNSMLGGDADAPELPTRQPATEQHQPSSPPTGTMPAPRGTATKLTGSPCRRPMTPARTDTGTVLRVTISELMLTAPRLHSFLTTSNPAWPDVVDAADRLRMELEISNSLWGEACLTMGREHATIAVAIVSTKPPGYFRSSPGGYFHGMVSRAKTGNLNLARTLWSLRLARTAKPRPQHAETNRPN